ncbi:sigma-70 family RNA polymerase sigma factor [Niallia endozanthoxylica]|uniref:Sigma-70 family RNA polymerase sigma factor n=1 Tax=Niallia endozanthoxylica TaxID=2036016 RepID=A0A5J5HR02_9BACI|nr:sigma-70 family RNA polymerase sigma factor [Niallia endozanthoxylica]
MICLVKKAQKGDDKAFLKLYQQYQEDIYRIVYVYVKNQNDALDVVQEVAYLSFKNIHTLKNPEHFKTWLIKIAITCSINLIKKNQKVIQLKPEDEEFIGLEDEDVSLSITLQELLEQLNEDEKSVVILKFYEGYSFKEIADLLNIPLGTAKSVLYRALNKLRKNLKEADICE